MSPTETLSERLTLLEAEVAEIKRHIAPPPPLNGWLEQVSGSFKDEPDFAEVLRLGSEIRNADVPAGE